MLCLQLVGDCVHSDTPFGSETISPMRFSDVISSFFIFSSRTFCYNSQELLRLHRQSFAFRILLIPYGKAAHDSTDEC
jgi:hypothetical protein